jgi:hypothetical protein
MMPGGANWGCLSFGSVEVDFFTVLEAGAQRGTLLKNMLSLPVKIGQHQHVQ